MSQDVSESLKAGSTLLIASHNKGKVREIAELLQPFGISAVAASELDLPEPVETGSTFAENATLKAIAASTATGLLALSDDSGLEVDALGGAPGIHSARWGGGAKDFGVAMQRVQEELEKSGSPDRRANFTCALALAEPDGTVQVFEGKVFGTIAWPPRGDRGFGYDPIFVPDGHTETFGEMEPQRKHAMSHRARAFQKLMASLK